METYATVIFNNPLPFYNNKRYSDRFDVVIDKLPCEFYFYIYKGEWYFHIQDRHINETDYDYDINHCYLHKCRLKDNDWFPEFDKESDITIDIIQKFISKMLELLEILEFSKIDGIFVTKEIGIKHRARNVVFEKYLEKENIDSQCSVCMEPTKTNTPCDHILCIPCWIKIKNKCCPICRRDISFFKNS
jgi:hypothetical protein